MDIMDYVKPELLVVAVALYIIGVGLKKAEKIKDNYIPFILGGIGIALCALWVCANSPLGNTSEVLMAIFTSIVQGVLVAGLSNYVHQLFKQFQSKE